MLSRKVLEYELPIKIELQKEGGFVAKWEKEYNQFIYSSCYCNCMTYKPLTYREVIKKARF